MIFFSSPLIAATSEYLAVQDIRTYESGFVVRVAETVNSNCGYAGTLQVFKENPNYNATVSLFLTAYAMNKKIRAYYSGCGVNKATSSGANVHITGWLINP